MVIGSPCLKKLLAQCQQRLTGGVSGGTCDGKAEDSPWNWRVDIRRIWFEL